MASIAYRVGRAGTITELALLDYITEVSGQEPTGAAPVQNALRNGELEGLHALEKQLCAWGPS